MKLPASLRGPYVLARHEFLVNLKSVRVLIMLVAFGLVVLGGAYGLSGGFGGGGGPSLSPLRGWGHPSVSPTGEHIAVVWVSDPFGNPLTDRSVRFYIRDLAGEEDIGTLSSDSEGFARLPVGSRTDVAFEVRSGNVGFGASIFWDTDPGANFTIATWGDNLDDDGLRDDFGFHVLALDGTPVAAQIYVNNTLVTSTDPRGYAQVELPPAESNIIVEVDGERETFVLVVFPDPVLPPAFSGPDFVLFIIAGGFAPFVLPIFAIVIAFDSISKERVQGTLDLLLSRPVSRTGTLFGKLLGTFSAVAIPVTLVNLVGIGVLTAVSGRGPTWTFAGSFLGLSVLLIAYYVLLQLSLSTLAKTSGTAILFGILVWLAFNVLYYVITIVLSAILFPRDFEGQFRFLQVVVLGNPSQIYQQLVGFAAPEDIGSGFGQFGGTALDLPGVAIAAGVWFALLLVLALWTFHRKGAE